MRVRSSRNIKSKWGKEKCENKWKGLFYNPISHSSADTEKLNSNTFLRRVKDWLFHILNRENRIRKG